MKKTILLTITLVMALVSLVFADSSPPIAQTQAFVKVEKSNLFSPITTEFEQIQTGIATREVKLKGKVEALQNYKPDNQVKTDSLSLLTVRTDEQNNLKCPNWRHGYNGNLANRIRADTFQYSF